MVTENKLGTIVFLGISGEKYTFHAYTLDTSFKNEGGVYVFTRRHKNSNGGYTFDLLYIGQADKLGARVNPQHEKWNDALNLGLNSVCAMLVNGDQARLDVETDLRHYYVKTPLNDQ